MVTPQQSQSGMTSWGTTHTHTHTHTRKFLGASDTHTHTHTHTQKFSHLGLFRGYPLLCGGSSSPSSSLGSEEGSLSALASSKPHVPFRDLHPRLF